MGPYINSSLALIHLDYFLILILLYSVAMAMVAESELERCKPILVFSPRRHQRVQLFDLLDF